MLILKTCNIVVLFQYILPFLGPIGKMFWYAAGIYLSRTVKSLQVVVCVELLFVQENKASKF